MEQAFHKRYKWSYTMTLPKEKTYGTLFSREKIVVALPE